MHALRATLARAAAAPAVRHGSLPQLRTCFVAQHAQQQRTLSSGADSLRPAVTMLSEDEEVRPAPTLLYFPQRLCRGGGQT